MEGSLSAAHKAPNVDWPIRSTAGYRRVATGGTPASASTLSASPVPSNSPNAVVCNPAPGTILSSTATSNTEAWIASNVSSSYVAGPGAITRSYSATSTVSSQVSASFALSESLLFASAKQTYGVTLGASLAHAATWSYTLNVASGHTDKVQQYHQGYEIGIKQTYVGAPGQLCAAQTETSGTGNYFPAISTADSSYCYALISYNNPPPEVGSGCYSKP